MQLKILKNGLVIVSGAVTAYQLAKWLAVHAYNKAGPFTNAVAPAVNASFLNGLEKYLNPGVSRNGVPLMSWFGPYAVTTASAFYNHNLVDQNGTAIVPDTVLFLSDGVSSSTHTATGERATMTTTQVKITGDSSLTITGVALKF